MVESARGNAVQMSIFEINGVRGDACVLEVDRSVVLWTVRQVVRVCDSSILPMRLYV